MILIEPGRGGANGDDIGSEVDVEGTLVLLTFVHWLLIASCNAVSP